MFAAISIVGGLIAVGLAIDLGRLYFTQRDLQRVANMAALDSVRIAGGCFGANDDPAAAALAEALASVQRNGGQAAWLQNSSADILGRMDVVGVERTFLQPTRIDNRAVQIRLARPAPARLIPLLSGGGGVTLRAQSAASNTPSALVQVGSRLANVDPADEGALDALLSGLLGGPLSLDVLSYEALFDAQIPLGAVLENLDRDPSGTPADDPATLGDFILAVANTIGDPAAAAAAQAMFDAADSSRTVIPSQVLGIDDPVSPSFASAGDVLVAAAAASLTEPVTIPVSLPPPLAGGGTTLALGDPGGLTRLRPGGTLEDLSNFAHNTSLKLQTESPLNLGALGLVGNLAFFVEAGQSTATVDAIRCARRGTPEDRVDVTATSSIARLGIGRFDDINAPNPEAQPVTLVDAQQVQLPVNLGPLLGGLVQFPVRVTVTASAFVDIGQTDSDFFDDMVRGETRRLGTPGAASLAQALAAVPGNLEVDVEVEVLGNQIPVIRNLVNAAAAVLDTALTNTVTTAITGTLLTQIDDILGPQLEMLGVTIGGADVSVVDIDAEEPLLFTH